LQLNALHLECGQLREVVRGYKEVEQRVRLLFGGAADKLC
jgi:hypothetical protein